MSRPVQLRHMSLLFFGSLFGLLLLSWALLTPKLVQRELGMTRADLLYKSQDLPVIANALEQIKVERNEDIDPSPMPIFRALEHKRVNEGASLAVWLTVHTIATQYNLNNNTYVTLQNVSYSNEGYVVTGEVQNAGLQGATVLAEFMNQLENHQSLQIVRYPSFSRIQRDGALVTPFTTVLLHD